MALFDSKSFNQQAFKYTVDRVPNLKTNEMKKSKALAPNADIRAAFSSQSGTAYARIAMKGLADGEAVNYDGQTDIKASRTKTFEQGVVVVAHQLAHAVCRLISFRVFHRVCSKYPILPMQR